MSRLDFVRRHQESWTRLEAVLDDLDKRKFNADAGVLPELYRRCCHHLAIVRQRRYDAALEARLHDLAQRGYHRLYRRDALPARGLLRTALEFVAIDFPRLVRRRAALFWLATALFYGPGIAMSLLVLEQPDSVYLLLDREQVESFEEMYLDAPQGTRDASEDFAMFGFYVFNNVSIAFRTFAGGLFYGLGTLFFLVFNGLILGAVFTHLVHAGTSANLLTFVVTHGAFELTALVLAGVGGLVLGGALVAPGSLRRVDALRASAPEALRFVLGAAILLFVAAFLEAFWSGSDLASPRVKLIVGALAWVGVTGLLLFGGRRGRRHP